MCCSYFVTYVFIYILYTVSILLIDGLCVCLQDPELGDGHIIGGLLTEPWLNNQSLRACLEFGLLDALCVLSSIILGE